MAANTPQLPRAGEAAAPESLAQRRLALVRRSQQLRGQLLRDSQSLAPWWGVADRVLRTVAWLRAHPLAVGAALAACAVAKPQRLWRWGGRAWALWRAWRRIKGLWPPGG